MSLGLSGGVTRVGFLQGVQKKSMLNAVDINDLPILNYRENSLAVNFLVSLYACAELSLFLILYRNWFKLK